METTKRSGQLIGLTVEQNRSRSRAERQGRPRDARPEGTECIREPRPRRSRAGPSQCAAFGAAPPPPDPIAARTAARATSPSTRPPASPTARSAALPAACTERSAARQSRRAANPTSVEVEGERHLLLRRVRFTDGGGVEPPPAPSRPAGAGLQPAISIATASTMGMRISRRLRCRRENGVSEAAGLGRPAGPARPAKGAHVRMD